MLELLSERKLACAKLASGHSFLSVKKRHIFLDPTWVNCVDAGVTVLSSASSSGLFERELSVPVG